MGFRSYFAKAPFFSAQVNPQIQEQQSYCEIISERSAALHAFQETHSQIQLNNEALVTNPSPLFRLRKERILMVAVDANGTLCNSSHPLALNSGMREALIHLKEELDVEIALTGGLSREQLDSLSQEMGRLVDSKKIPVNFSMTVAEAANRSGQALLSSMIEDYVQRTRILANPWNLVMVDDTRPGLQAARNAKMWSVALLAFSHDLQMQKPLDESNIVLMAQRREALLRQYQKEGGVDFAVMFPCDLIHALREINQRVKQGEKPGERPMTVIKEGYLLPEAEMSYTFARLR